MTSAMKGWKPSMYASNSALRRGVRVSSSEMVDFSRDLHDLSLVYVGAEYYLGLSVSKDKTIVSEIKFRIRGLVACGEGINSLQCSFKTVPLIK